MTLGDCDCRIVTVEGEPWYRVVHCPLHEAAPRLLNALADHLTLHTDDLDEVLYCAEQDIKEARRLVEAYVVGKEGKKP
jgi:hypothetical protein